MHILLKVFVFMVFLFVSTRAIAQEIKCYDGEVSVKNFRSDSTFTFNSRFVKYGVVENIRNSKFPVEIRMFSYSRSSEIVDLKIIQASNDSIYFSTQRVWIASTAGIPKYKRVYETDKFTVNVISRPIERRLNKYSSSFANLNKLNFFNIQGVVDASTFVLDRNTGINDGTSAHWIEIKLKNKVRNINYVLSARVNDPDSTRQYQMEKIITLINNNLNPPD